MLRSISHSRARAVTNCPACRALSSASSASASLTVAAASSSRLASARPRLSLHDNRRTTSWSTRAVATEAQQSLQVEEEDLEPAPLTEAEEMDALLASFEQQMAPESPTASPPSPPEPEPEPTAPAAPLFSPSLLLSTFPQGPPTSSDLDSLAPRNFNILDASSPESHRIIYAKKWNSSFARLDSAFTKRQLLVLVDSPQPEGLGLNLLDPRYKASVKGKKNKHWKPKKATQMTKRELGHAIMVLHWEMPNPETLPTPRKGPQKVDAVPLSDKMLFLLLSPHSTVITDLGRQMGIAYSFSRNPESGALSLILRGNVQSVAQARADIEGLVDSSYQQLLHLPRPANSLRPEVYQSISRMAKAFLEPAEEEGNDVLRATATERRYLERLERYLLAAFTHDAARRSTPLFASLPVSLSSLTYSMYPFTPPFRPPFITGGATSSLARIQAIARPQSADASSNSSPMDDLLSWSGKMGFDAMERVPLDLGPSGAGGALGRARVSGQETVIGALRAGFKDADVAGEGEWEVRGKFGSVVWPLYAGGDGALGPKLDGEWDFEDLLRWREGKGKESRTIFLPSPPTNFLSTTGVLTPTTAPESPFAALLPSATAEDAADSAAAIVAQSPVLDSEEGFRRLVYRPVELPARGEPSTRIEIEFDGATHLRSKTVVREKSVEVLVPTGSSDFQITLSRRKKLSERALPGSFFVTNTEAPHRILVDSAPYLLETDRWIRRTVIDPLAEVTTAPTSLLSSSPTPSTPAVIATPRQLRETFHDRGLEGSRGVEVSALLAGGPDAEQSLTEVVRSGAWKKALEGLERRACERPSRATRLKGADGVAQRVFGAGR